MKKLTKGKLGRLKSKPADAENSTLRWSESYTDYLRSECHLAENTVMAYTRDMRKFTNWLGNRNIKNLTISELSDFMGHLNSENLAPSSIARNIVAVNKDQRHCPVLIIPVRVFSDFGYVAGIYLQCFLDAGL